MYTMSNKSIESPKVTSRCHEEKQIKKLDKCRVVPSIQHFHTVVSNQRDLASKNQGYLKAIPYWNLDKRAGSSFKVLLFKSIDEKPTPSTSV